MTAQGDLPADFKKVLDKATVACEKLLKEGMRLSKEKALAEKRQVMKEAWSILSGHHRDLEHVSNWNELPSNESLTKGSLDSFLGKVAQDVSRFNREIEGAKGMLKAISN